MVLWLKGYVPNCNRMTTILVARLQLLEMSFSKAEHDQKSVGVIWILIKTT